MHKIFASVTWAAAALAVVGVCAQSAPPRPASSGPVSIGVHDADLAFVLMADGRVAAVDIARGSVGSAVYRVPYGFDAIDMTVGRFENTSVMLFTVNSQSSGASYLLERFEDKREVWVYMPTRGVYVGIALDGNNGVAYVANSSNNVVYRVRVGQEKGAARELSTLSLAERIGVLAVDGRGKRLFVSNVGPQQLIVVPLDGGQKRYISVPSIHDARALAWNETDQRLYVADSGRETVWSMDPTTGGVQAAFKDPRFKGPAGLAFAPNGMLWLVDEGARAAFELSTGDKRVLRMLLWGRGSS